MRSYRAYDQQFLHRAGGVPGVMRGDSLSSGYLDKKLQELSQGHPYSQLSLSPSQPQLALPVRLSRSSSSASQKSIIESPMDMDSFSNQFTSRASLGQEAVPVAVAVANTTAAVPTAMAVPAAVNSSSSGLSKPSFFPPPVSRSNSMQGLGSLDDIDLAKALDADNLDAFWDAKPVDCEATTQVTATRNVTYDPMMGTAPSFAFTLSR